MKPMNPGNLAAAPGPRRTPPFGDQEVIPEPPPQYPTPWKRAIWLIPLVAGSLVLVTMAVLRYRSEPEAVPRYGGQVIKEITFEGGTLNDQTHGVDRVRNGVTLEREMSMKGLYSAHLAGGGAYIEQRLPGTGDLYMSFYVRLMELPSKGDLRLVVLSTDKTVVGNLLVRNGKLRLRVDKSPIGPDSAQLVPGELYRIGVHQRAGNGANAILEAYLAAGDTPFAAPFAATTSGTWIEGADRVRIGMTTSNGVNAFIDDVRLHADEMPAPSVVE